MADFYSDTRTRPSRAMIEAALSADLGDEQQEGDPTTDALCARVAELFGKEAAVFLPTGTMCNQIAIRVHCTPGDEVICDAKSHIANFEAGAPAALSGVSVRSVESERGIFTAEALRAAIRPPSRFTQASRMVSVEQTTNLGGGAVWPLARINEVAEAAGEAGLALHIDGARIVNAWIASGILPATFCAQADSCWLDFTKGLGAPFGAVMAGSSEFVERAWRIKQQWGGAMRQSGVMAAMCIYALNNNLDRIAEDHALASWIGQELQGMSGIARVLPIETNIVIADLDETAPAAWTLAERLEDRGYQFSAFGARRLRIVTHLDVNATSAAGLCMALRKELG